MVPAIVLPLVTLVTAVAALALDPAKSNPVATLWTFQNKTWIENLAVRANGNVLCTSLNRAAIYQVDPFKHVAGTLHQFASTDGCLGIAETSSDVFVVVTANGLPEPVSLIANLTDVVLPDGVVTLPYDPSVVLVADAAKGVVWRVNAVTGDHTMAIDGTAFKPTDEVPLGVNGIHILNNELYFTNLATNSVGKVTITPDGSTAGKPQILTSKALAADDFALSDSGIVYAAGANTLWRVSADGHTIAFGGDPNSMVLQGITSARFGQTAVDRDILYMSTQGGLLENPPGSEVHGGQLLGVNINVFDFNGDED
ncbi:hypothetical protein MBLNU13_g10211t1 [Cladosporium sp. NU13]